MGAQKGIGLRKMLAAKKAAIRRQWRRMHAVQHTMLRIGCGGRAQFLSGAAPQQKHRGRVALGQVFDHRVGEHLPAQFAVAVGAVFFYGQHTVQQQHALPRPGAQVAVAWRGRAQVLLLFGKDIAQRGRDFHPGRHREGQAVRLAFAVVRVLAENDHFHLIGRGEVERVKHGFALWINLRASGVALLQSVVQRAPFWLRPHRRQGAAPVCV